MRLLCFEVHASRSLFYVVPLSKNSTHFELFDIGNTLQILEPDEARGARGERRGV